MNQLISILIIFAIHSRPSKFITTAIAVILFSFGLVFFNTSKDDIKKLKTLKGTVQTERCIETGNSSGNCTIDDIDCWSCEATGNTTCCQVAYSKCYSWITVMGDN